MTAARTRRLDFLVLGIASLAISLAILLGWLCFDGAPTADPVARAELERTTERVESEAEPVVEAAASLAIEGATSRTDVGETRFVCSVIGQVVERGGAPFAHVRIEAWHRVEQPDDLELAGFNGEPSALIATAESDTEGRFRFDELPCFGVAEIEPILNGYTAPNPAIQARLAAGPPIDAGVIEVSREARASGIVVDEEGRPIAGAKVGAFDSENHRETMSVADGTFVFPRLVPGVHVFYAQDEDHAPAMASANVRTLSAGDRADDLRIMLEPLDTIDGLVIDEARAPVGSALVTAERVLGTEVTGKYFGRSVEIGRTQSSADGTFAIRVPRNRNAGVTARSRGVTSERVTSFARSPLELTIPRTPAIRLEVLDRATGIRLVPEELLMFGRQHGNDGLWIMSGFGAADLASMRGDDGLLTIPYGELELDNLIGWQALAELAGYRSGLSDLATFPVISDQTVRIEMSRGREVSGRVLLDGLGVGGAEVASIERGNRGAVARAIISDVTGRFRFPASTLRALQLSARAPGIARVTIDVAADPSGRDVAADLELKR